MDGGASLAGGHQHSSPCDARSKLREKSLTATRREALLCSAPFSSSYTIVAAFISKLHLYHVSEVCAHCAFVANGPAERTFREGTLVI